MWAKIILLFLVIIGCSHFVDAQIQAPGNLKSKGSVSDKILSSSKELNMTPYVVDKFTIIPKYLSPESTQNTPLVDILYVIKENEKLKKENSLLKEKIKLLEKIING